LNVIRNATKPPSYRPVYPIENHYNRVLNKPYLGEALTSYLLKMNKTDRDMWMDAIKHRSLRLADLKHKRQAINSIKHVENTIDHLLTSNNTSTDQGSFDGKKKVARQLLTRTEAKFPRSLITNTQPIRSKEVQQQTVPASLSDLLLKSTSKTLIDLPTHLHPTFGQVDLEKHSQWKDRSEVLSVNYRGQKVVHSIV
jgi:hypothetical protein